MSLLQGNFAGHVVVLAHLPTLGLKHHFKQAFHGVDVEAEELKLPLEHPDHMPEDLAELGLPLGYQIAALLNVLSDRWQHQFRVNGAIPLDQCQSHRRGHQLPTRVHHVHILSLDDVVDMRGYRGVRADSILLHL